MPSRQKVFPSSSSCVGLVRLLPELFTKRIMLQQQQQRERGDRPPGPLLQLLRQERWLEFQPFRNFHYIILGKKGKRHALLDI